MIKLINENSFTNDKKTSNKTKGEFDLDNLPAQKVFPKESVIKTADSHSKSLGNMQQCNKAPRKEIYVPFLGVIVKILCNFH